MSETEPLLDRDDATDERSPEPQSAGGGGRGAVALLTKPIVQAVVLAVVAWPFSPSNLNPCFSVDCSWQFALVHAATARLAFGTHVVFSYGPLGFLLVPELFSSATAALDFLFTFSVFVGLFWVILWGLQGYVPRIVSFLVAYVAGSTVTFKGAALIPLFGVNVPLHAQILLLLALPIGLAAILAPPDSDTPRRSWVALGAMTAVALLILPALAIGFGVLIVAALACRGADRLRAIGWLGVPAAVIGVVAWEATGNGPGNVGPFVSRSTELAAGFTSALALHPHLHTLFIVANVVDGIVVAAMAYLACRRCSRRAQIATAVVTLVTLWLLAKEALVRADTAHAGFLLAVVPLMVAAYVRFVRLPALSIGAVVLTCFLAYVSSTGASFATVPQATTGRVDRAAANFFREARDLVSPSHRTALVATMRRVVRNAFAVPPSMVQATRGRCVDVDPIDDAVFWAYPRTKVCELPVIQDYAAYTTGLDQVDADALGSADAPQEILRRASPPIDMVPRAWDPPLTQLQMECRYRQVSATAEWQLTVRVHDRCGVPVRIREVRGHQGQALDVPRVPQGYAVAATVSLAPPLSWRIADLVMRPGRYCATTVVAGVVSTGQFVLGTQADLHMLRPASTLGYSPPFAPPSTDTISVRRCGAGPSSSPMTVSFYRIRMR